MTIAVGRREFLHAAAGAVMLPASPLTAPRAKSLPIVVVGAGLSGLHAAERLRAAGDSVVVLEARRRPGGRVRTVRAPFDGRLVGEAGPIRIASQHRRVVALAARFKLPLIPFASGGGDPLAVIAGIRARPGEMELIGERLQIPAAERGLTQAALLERYTSHLPESLADAEMSEDASWEPYDRVTWPEWLRGRGASAGEVAVMTLGGDSRALSALYVLRQFAMLGAPTLYKIQGGMDRLPRAMATALAGVVRYGAAATRIEPANDRVRVDYATGVGTRTIDARAVVVTTPPAVTSRIATTDPELARRFASFRAVPSFPATRLLVETRHRRWHDIGLSGSARTDYPAEIWDAAYDQGGDGGLLAATVGGEAGAALAAQSRAACRDAAVDIVAAAFPPIRGDVRLAWAYRWPRDAWAGGAFIVFRPRQMLPAVRAFAKPVGRIHFAGEHTAPWTGWMEGALQSAERVAEEVLK